MEKGHAEYKICKSSRICSNHFADGKPSYQKPYPMKYLTPSDSVEKRTEFNRSQQKRRKLERQRKRMTKTIKAPSPARPKEGDDVEAEFKSSFCFIQLRREPDIVFYTGFKSGKLFQTVFRASQAPCITDDLLERR